MSYEGRPPRVARRTDADRLRDALVALAGGHPIVASHVERAWASITFEGARHTVKLVFDGEDAVAAGEEFVACLPEHEFALPRHLVADATVLEIDHTLVPQPRMAVSCELLLLVDA